MLYCILRNEILETCGSVQAIAPPFNFILRLCHFEVHSRFSRVVLSGQEPIPHGFGPRGTLLRTPEFDLDKTLTFTGVSAGDLLRPLTFDLHFEPYMRSITIGLRSVTTLPGSMRPRITRLPPVFSENPSSVSP